MKKFFSSIWFKCIATLLLIVLVSGGSISVLNNLLYVSPEERTGRAVKKIYGEVQAYNVLDINEEFEYEAGEITMRL